MFHGFAALNENEHETFGYQDESHKPVDLSIVKLNDKSD
jgi:hypothetical protein